MDVIEKAIRNAFEKGDPGDRTFREKVYRSAFAALERAIETNAAATPEAAARRRAALKATIADIESEFIPAVPPVMADRRDPVFAPDAQPGEAQAPRVDRRREDVAMPRDPVLEPRFDDPAAEADHGNRGQAGYGDDIPGERREFARRRHPIATAFIGLAALLLLAAGAWWWSGGLGQPGPGVVVEAPTAQEEAAAPPAAGPPPTPVRPGQAESLEAWTTVFTPGDPTAVSVPADAEAAVVGEQQESYLRIRSGASGSAVVFDVGQGILERLAGRRAIFVIVARAEEGRPTQMSVGCDLAALGECGRKRYEVGYERGDFLFDMDLPDARPASGGTISIVSDIDNAGKAVDIYAIRVTPAE